MIRKRTELRRLAGCKDCKKKCSWNNDRIAVRTAEDVAEERSFSTLFGDAPYGCNSNRR